MSERLTDEELELWSRSAGEVTRSMAKELRTLRAAALTEAEREALAFAASVLRDEREVLSRTLADPELGDPQWDSYTDALAILAKLTGAR